jgi:hypothetical protein
LNPHRLNQALAGRSTSDARNDTTQQPTLCQRVLLKESPICHFEEQQLNKYSWIHRFEKKTFQQSGFRCHLHPARHHAVITCGGSIVILEKGLLTELPASLEENQNSCACHLCWPPSALFSKYSFLQ